VSRGFQVPRCRQPPFAIALLAGALVASLILAPAPARAQPAKTGMNNTSTAAADDGGGSSLLSPQLNGNPQRFRSPRKGADNAPQRFGQLPNFDYQPAQGAGTTGFDSTNVRKRSTKPGQGKPGQAKAGARPVGAGDAGTQPPGGAAPGSDPAANAATPPRTPRQLQPPGAPLAARLRLQNRPGAPPPNVDAVPATIATTVPSRRPFPEDKPFDPLGVQVGAFNFRPAMDYTRGWDGNAARNSAPPRQSSWFNIYSPELLANSNWDRHELTASIRGSYVTYDTMHQLDRPTAEVRLNGRVDVTRDTRIDLEGRYLLFTDYLGSPNIQAGLAHLPIGMDYGATVGLSQHFNRFDVTLKGLFDRTVYNDSVFTDGSTSSNAGRNFNRYGAQLRTSYEVTPGVKPFVEVGADRRQYDLEIDAGGNNRTSLGRYGKVGTSFELRPTLTGEASFGYLARSYEDPTLEEVRGWTTDAAIVWWPSALTSVKLISSTTTAEQTTVGVSAAFTRDTTIQVDHAFRRWLIATVRFGRGFDDYVGSTREDIRYVASVGLAYYLSRELVLKGEFRQDWRFSNTPGNDYFANVWLVGLRLQR
jgi:hypothetical protein